MSKTVVATIGFVTGVIFLLLAAVCFVAAIRWGGLGRDGAATGYAVTGLFLVVSGGGGIVAVWNHYFRVLKRAGGGASSH